MRHEAHDEARFLAATVDAYRRATAGSADGGATRVRVLVAAGARAGRRALLRRALFGLSVGLVAALSGHVAWTAVGQWRAARLPPPRVSPPTPAPSARVAILPEGPGPLAAPTAFAGAPASPPEEAASPVSRHDAAEASAYGRAHAAHFASDDPMRALGLWDAYLRGFPAGAFVPEARFNRALCLLRLGHREAALAALRPFANGAYGGYRVREARTLTDWTTVWAGTSDARTAR